MGTVADLRCVRCDRTYTPGEVEYTCQVCKTEGILDIEYDYERIKWEGFGSDRLAADPDPSPWRYAPLLPIEDRAAAPPLQLGPTPLYRFPNLAAELGLADLLVKDEGRLPTGSFKDRASWLGVTRARELGYREVACASTGNAACSLAGMCASVSLVAHIFVPESIPEAKLAQLQVFGADVLVVDSSYDDAYYLCTDAAEEFRWLNRNCAFNPYLVEGKKTAGLELGEHLAKDMPDWLAVAVGDGCTIAGIWEGLREMRRFGVLGRLPRLLGVQAAGANPLWGAFHAGKERIEPKEATTLADSIAVGRPRNAVKALRAVREAAGSFVQVDDEEILEAQRLLAARTGVFAEPTGSAAIAGVRRAAKAGLVGSDERVLVVVTGNGLKDVRAVTRAFGRPEAIPCDLEAVRANVAVAARASR